LKEIFSKALQTINQEENIDKSLKVLQKCFENLNDYNAAIIAQTIARVFIKAKDFKNAEIWAEKALRLQPENFSFEDTLGNVFKNDLKEKCKNLTIGDYSLSDEVCCQILQLGNQAVFHFQTSYQLSQERTLQQGRSSQMISLDDENDDEFNRTEASIFTGNLGQIETNLELLKLFMRSNDLKNRNQRECFISCLTNKKERLDLSTILPDVSWDWNDYILLVSSLWQKTLECFSEATRKMNFVDPHKKPVKSFVNTLGRQMEELEDIVGSLSNSNSQNLQYLRSYLQLRCAQNFIWVLLYFNDKQLFNIFNKVLEMKKIIKEKKTLSLGTNEKQCLLNAVICSIYKANSHQGEGIFNALSKPMIRNTVLDFCRELMVSELNVPEPYFFYMLLSWPADKIEENPKIYDEELFLKCQQKLRAFASGENRSQDEKTKTNPFFFLTVKPQITNLHRLYSFNPRTGSLEAIKRNNRIKKLRGQILDDSHIGYKLSSGATMKIRPADLNQIRSGGMTKVTFQLGFTLSGPIAYSIENAGEKSAIEKMDAFQNKVST
jgi:tetratricopeptide (TPR) repeat protein